MAVNKIIFEGTTLIDLTDSTIAAGDLRTGTVAYDKAGNRIVGETDWSINVQSGTVSEIAGTADDYLLTMTT